MSLMHDLLLHVPTLLPSASLPALSLCFSPGQAHISCALMEMRGRREAKSSNQGMQAEEEK